MKSLQIILVFLIAPIFLSNSTAHEYYVSVTKIEYSEEQESLQIITQIFIDDLEEVIKKRYDESLKLAPDNKSKLIDNYINRYLTDKFKVSVNNKAMDFVFIGKEYKDDITYCYLEIENVTDIQSVKVVNKALFDVFPEQQNIVRLKMLNKNKSFLLIPEKDSCVLNFK